MEPARELLAHNGVYQSTSQIVHGNFYVGWR